MVLANLDASGFSCIGTLNLLYNMSNCALYICKNHQNIVQWHNHIVLLPSHCKLKNYVRLCKGSMQEAPYKNGIQLMPEA